MVPPYYEFLQIRIDLLNQSPYTNSIKQSDHINIIRNIEIIRPSLYNKINIKEAKKLFALLSKTLRFENTFENRDLYKFNKLMKSLDDQRQSFEDYQKTISESCYEDVSESIKQFFAITRKKKFLYP